MTNSTNQPTLLLTIEQVAQHLGVTTRTVRRWMNERGFPEPIRFTARLHRWQPSEVQEWIEFQRAKSDAATRRTPRVGRRR